MKIYEIAPGRQVGDRYTIVSEPRRGGLSVGFEVEDVRDGSRCMMKLFPGGLFENKHQSEEFQEKLRPWTYVESEAVIRLRDVVAIDEINLALISDLPTGEALRTRLDRETRLSREEVVTLGIRLLGGLEAIHGHDLVHGDIKPFNIFVEGQGGAAKPVLVDGGLTIGLWTAKELGDKTALIGTPYYAPFEQFGGDAPDVRSDIYNAATVLYECATGVLPWAGKSFLEVFQAKIQEPPSMRARAPEVEVDERLDAVIVKGCRPARNDRYASAAEFRAALEEAS